MITDTPSLSIAQPHPTGVGVLAKVGLALASIGLLILLIALAGVTFSHTGWFIGAAIVGIVGGTSLYAAEKYLHQPKGVKNNGVWQSNLTARGIVGWMIGILLTGFYVLIYWWPEYLGLGDVQKNIPNTGLVHLFDPISRLFSGSPASQWFMYGTLYSLAVLSMGIKFLFKYRGNRYHTIRTLVVVGCQLIFAYFIPEILSSLQHGGAYFNKDIKLFWPLNYSFGYGYNLDAMRSSGGLGMFYLVVGIAMFALVAPIITYFVGKRWYCSWVCGCGGLAETAGDPFRQLSSKKMYAWKIERWLIHSVLAFVTIMTAAVLYGYFSGASQIFGLDIYHWFQKPYGFLIGAIFSGVVGVGFYPLMGNRVWCRFGCPLAAYMGIIQRFKSRFRITTNGGQCISCGNCSTYCEQGIDVRSYAQKGQNIVRASCVGCGVCASVCPRGVLKLENNSTDGRIKDQPELTGLLRD
ncbi:MAG: 4Fe-4S binding protein [Chitinophagaceae bacterium]